MLPPTQITRARAFWLIAGACFAPFMARLDMYIVNISLPTISKHFHAGTGTVSLVLLVYLLVMTSSMLIFGKLEDRLGLKNIFLWGYSLFVAGSLLCGISLSIFMLILARGVQGMGAAMLMTGAFTAIGRFIPHEKTGAAFGVLSMVAALGVSVGPALGGFITGLFSWRWIFLINAPLGILGALLAAAAIPDRASRAETTSERPPFDVPGAVLSTLGLMSLLYSLNQGGEQGWTSPDIVIGFALAFVLLGLFIWWEHRHPSPLIAVSLIARKDFRNGLIAALLAYVLMAGNGFLMPFYLEYVHGLSPQKSGLVFSCFAGVALVLTPIAGRLSDKINPGLLCRTAMFAAAAICLFFAATLDLHGLLSVILTLVAFGVAYSFFIPPINNQLMSLAPAGQKGAASGLLQTMIGVGMAVGVCSMETVYSDFNGMITGFRAAYLLAALTCAVAAVFCVVRRREED